MSKETYQVEIPTTEYFLSLVSCRKGCPVNTNAGGYVRAIADKEYKKAFEIARSPNPFATSCGRICAHPCEAQCRRSFIDEAVSIRALKRFITEKHGPESPHPLLPFLPSKKRKDIKVAVIGAGPTGLSCAHDLAGLFGYAVTVFEASRVAGGMLYLGIPEYRYPRKVLQSEIDQILSFGVELKFNQKLGKDFSLKDLKREGFKAIFIAIGASQGRKLDLEGVALDGVINGVDFLLNVNLGYRVELGNRVVVVGGGNVAIDVARTVIREGLPAQIAMEDGSTLVDAARAALRLGVREVRVVCLESRKEMPAFYYEVDEAEKEGIKLHPSKGPKRIIGKNNKAIALETLDVAAVFDKDGNFNPSFIKNSERQIPADTIILSIGQKVDFSSFAFDPELILSHRGTIAVEKETLSTNLEGIFTGGDCGFGPRIVIDAVADGKKGAKSIHKYLSGLREQRRYFSFKNIGLDRTDEEYEKISRQEIPMLPVGRRIGFREVEISYDEKTAKKEAERCLWCHVATIFDSEKCILCGGCVDICPEFCYMFLKLKDLELNENLKSLFKKIYGTDDLAKIKDGAAIIKDEDKCIRCGLCAKRCPTAAITMELLSFQEPLYA